ncbi:MAG: right-handed parallel beta-helix repeat-containing protein [Blastocatellales bacterium]|nr:right-handed parallel beta-helix repeat-containing protein [Blastocatellales bacterium]
MLVLLGAFLIGVSGCELVGQTTGPSGTEVEVEANGKVEVVPAQRKNNYISQEELSSRIQGTGQTKLTIDGEPHDLSSHAGTFVTSRPTSATTQELELQITEKNRTETLATVNVDSISHDGSVADAVETLQANQQSIQAAIAALPQHKVPISIVPVLQRMFATQYMWIEMYRLGLPSSDENNGYTLTGTAAFSTRISAPIDPDNRPSVAISIGIGKPRPAVITLGSPPNQTTASFRSVVLSFDLTPVSGDSDRYVATVSLNNNETKKETQTLHSCEECLFMNFIDGISNDIEEAKTNVEVLSKEANLNAAQTKILASLVGYQVAWAYFTIVSRQQGNQPPNPGENHPPVVTNPGTQRNQEESDVSVSVLVNDPDGDTLTCTAAGLPQSVFIDPDTCKISGSLGTGTRDFYPIIVTVSDGRGGTASTEFEWRIYPHTIMVTVATDSPAGEYWPKLGNGDLRGALIAANDAPGPNRVVFDRPYASSIYLQRPLPHIVDRVEINGKNQIISDESGFINVDGSNSLLAADGFVFTRRASGSILKAMEIRGFIGDGVALQDASGVEIGGSNPEEGNIIVSNNGNAIRITNSSMTVIRFNLIGTNSPKGDFSGNGEAGIKILDSCDTRLYDNYILNNKNGIVTENSKNTVISNNRISNNNGNLPIDHDNDGVTPNDPGDMDGVVNTPTISFAGLSASGTFVSGSLNGIPSARYRLEWFWDFNLAAHFPGAGQARHPISETTEHIITTNASGLGSFGRILPYFPPTAFVAATASLLDDESNPVATSEVSMGSQVASLGVETFTRPAQVSFIFKNQNGMEEHLTASGSIAGRFYTNTFGIAIDTDGNGLDEVWFELTSGTLSAFSPSLGSIFFSLRDPTLPPYQRTMGYFEEAVNSTLMTLDIPPYRPVGSASLRAEMFLKAQTSSSTYFNLGPICLECSPDDPMSPCTIEQVPPSMFNLRQVDRDSEFYPEDSTTGMFGVTNGETQFCWAGRFEFVETTWGQRSLNLPALWLPIAVVERFRRRARHRRKLILRQTGSRKG